MRIIFGGFKGYEFQKMQSIELKLFHIYTKNKENCHIYSIFDTILSKLS